MNDEKKNGKNELGPLISDTAVPDIFFVQYMMELTREAICLYAWILMKAGYNSLSKDEILKADFFDEQTNSEALAELLRYDIVCKKGEDSYYLADLKMREVDEYYKIWEARGKSLDGLSIGIDPERDSLAQSINNTFYMGKMNQGIYRLIDKCLYEYKFEQVVVYRLFQEGKKDKQQFNYSAMCKKAEDWYKNGMTTSKSLEEYIKTQDAFESMLKSMGRLTRTRLNGLDIERIHKWVDTLNVSVPFAEAAFRANDFRQTVKLKNVEDTMLEWIAAGVKTTDEAAVYEQEKSKEQKRTYKRRKASTNHWSTGADIRVSEKLKEESPKNENESQSDGGQDILALFGDDDEDN